MISDDDGRTWRPRLIESLKASDTASEPVACLLPDGRILFVARAEVPASMWQSWSHDAGETWSKAQPIGFAGHSPCILLTSQGILLVAHRYTGTSIHYSLDYGKTWSPDIQISEVGGRYPCMTELHDGRVFISYSHFRNVMPKPLYGQLLSVDRGGVRPADPVSTGSPV